MLKLYAYDSEPLQVQFLGCVQSVWIVLTNICLDCCDPKGYRPEEIFEVCCVGLCSKVP
jgi:hypothetical protein